MARAIVRISFDGDYGSPDTTRVRKALEGRGLRKVGTAVYEGLATLDQLTAALREVLDVLDDPTADARLDHLWVYLDEPDPL